MSNIENDKIYIEVDSKLRPLLPKYLENRKKDLRDLQIALSNDDFEFIHRTSHTIKGHGASYGFVKLTEICKLMEHAALDRDNKLIKFLLKEYEKYVHSIELK